MDYIITITLNTDNADQDILRILENVPFHITDIIAGRTTGKTLIDINGNNVGRVTTVINKPETKPAENIDYVCNDCGSNDIGWDAFAGWDVEKQEMTLSSTYDHCECLECESTDIEQINKKG